MQRNLPEIVFASVDKAESQRISRWVRSGVLRRLVPRVYTSNNKDSDEAIVARNLYLILTKLFPGAVLSLRTALEGGPTETGDLFLTYKYSRKVILPGLSGLGNREQTDLDRAVVCNWQENACKQ